MATGILEISGKKYYFANKGYKQYGWKTINNKRYYFIDNNDNHHTADNDGQMATGFRKISGKKYLFGSDGVLNTANKAVKVDGAFYFIHDNGVVETSAGWLKIGSTYYYVDNSSGKLHTGWKRINDTSIFYLNPDNAKMVTGVKKIEGTLYYFNSQGYRATTKGWRTWNGDEYYAYANGTLAVNTTIDGKWLGPDGKAVAGMDGKAQGYSSNTNYLILINRSTHKIGVYKGSQGHWVNRTYESCADGNSSHPTPTGTFTTSHSMQYEDSSAGRHWYVTDFGSSSIWSEYTR